jgi:hypothetical protein
MAKILRPKKDQDLPLRERTSDVREDDVGGRNKLDSLIREIESSSKNSDLIVFNCMCTPVATGDDVNSLLKGHKKNIKCPFLHLHLRQNETEFFEEVFNKILKAKREMTTPQNKFLSAGKKTTINLVDFSPEYLKEELIPFLEDLGVKINTCIFPEIDLDDLKHYLSANLQIFFTGSLRQKLIQKTFAKLPIKTLVIDNPYTLEGANNCLNQIAYFFKKEDRVNDFLKQFKQDILEIKQNRLKAKQFHLGFVIDETTFSGLENPYYSSRPDILKILKEMGFKIEFLIYSPTKSLIKRVVILINKLGLKNVISIKTFKTPSDLKNLLKESRARAFYSDLFCDNRLTRTSKAQFSLRNFEMGISGFSRSLKNLLNLCSFSFFSDYGKYL